MDVLVRLCAYVIVGSGLVMVSGLTIGSAAKTVKWACAQIVLCRAARQLERAGRGHTG